MANSNILLIKGKFIKKCNWWCRVWCCYLYYTCL